MILKVRLRLTSVCHFSQIRGGCNCGNKIVTRALRRLAKFRRTRLRPHSHQSRPGTKGENCRQTSNSLKNKLFRTNCPPKISGREAKITPSEVKNNGFEPENFGFPPVPNASEGVPNCLEAVPNGVEGDYFGFNCGNRITSRMLSWPSSIMHRRSMPMPMPPAGGMPCSSATRKSSSSFCCSPPA